MVALPHFCGTGPASERRAAQPRVAKGPNLVAFAFFLLRV